MEVEPEVEAGVGDRGIDMNRLDGILIHTLISVIDVAFFRYRFLLSGVQSWTTFLV